MLDHFRRMKSATDKGRWRGRVDNEGWRIVQILGDQLFGEYDSLFTFDLHVRLHGEEGKLVFSTVLDERKMKN